MNPNSAWRGGHHVLATIDLVRGMYRAGADVHLHLIRSLVDMEDVPHSATVSWLLRSRGLSRLEEYRRAVTQRRYLAKLKPGDIAWLWPTVYLETFQEIARRGNPIVLEGINTRIAYSRRILYDTYQRESLTLGSLDDRIVEEEEMLSLASYFFSPSPLVSEAVTEFGSSFHGTVFESSYGANMPATLNVKSGKDGEVVVLFVGEDSLRKNLHGLLRAWHKLDPQNARLKIVGSISPAVLSLCAAELEMESVEQVGYVRNLDQLYRAADIFVLPSFEEGSPRVTYQAAGYGLPIVASKMGAGRLAERAETVATVDPFDTSDIAETLKRFIDDADLREAYGKRSADAAPNYEWDVVGKDRYRQLCEAFPDDDLSRTNT